MSLLTILIIIVVLLAITGPGKNPDKPPANPRKPDDPWPRRRPDNKIEEGDEDHDDDDGE